MGKALVIKGANFSTNKVATITFERIHTESITITDESISMTTLGGTYQIHYTLTPSNADDPVEWSTSNSSVCTVSENGIVTATGCGTATITGTSNSHSDTVSVTCVIEMTGIVKRARTTITPNSSSGHVANIDTYLTTSATGYDMYLAMVDTDSTKQELNVFYTLAQLNSETGKYYIPDVIDPSESGFIRVLENIGYPVPIKLPAGCTSIKLVGLNEKYAPYVMWYKSNTRANDSDENQYYFSAYKKSSPTPNNYSWDYKQETTLSIEDGYDSVTVLWRANTTGGATDFANLTSDQIAQFKLICY